MSACRRHLSIVLLLCSVLVQPAAAFETVAKQALLMDYDTGTVLFEKNADERMFPASMTKMMTAHLLFERLRDGSLSLEDRLPVSEKAWRKGGSKMFVEVGKTVKVEDLIRGIVVQSGNDATIVVAEGLAGSEQAFADQMNERARDIGMAGTQYRNASGWPDEEHFTTARDLAELAAATIREFPEFYHYYSEQEFIYAGIKQGNRNPLLYKDIGADGLKTGHTEAAGFGLTASATRGERRLILVLNGMESQRERSSESLRVIEWGFREWNNYPLFKEGEVVADVPVWLGNASTVPLVMPRAVLLTMERKTRKDMKVVLRYEEPIPAPIRKGNQVGVLEITAPGLDTISVPLEAGADVAALNAFGRVAAALEYLVWGASN